MNTNKADDASGEREGQGKSSLEGHEEKSGSAVGVGTASSPGDQLPQPYNVDANVNSNSPVASGENKSMDRWPRRNFILTATGLLATGITVGTTWYFGARSDERDERNAVRENERYARELPAPVGDGIRVVEALVENVYSWPQLFVSSELISPQDFVYGADRDETYRMIVNRRGGLYGRMSIDTTIESLRRTVLISGAHVKVRSLGNPPNATIFAPAPIGGGPGEETEILLAGVNLDSPRPVVRVLNPETFSVRSTPEERASVKNNPIILGDTFPEKQITLGPYDVKQIRIIAEARIGYYEWELFFDIIADGERQTIPVKATNYPLKLASPVRDYGVVLREAIYNLDGGFGGVQAINMAELFRWI